MAKTLTQKEWVQKAKENWNNAYDYSKAVYSGSKNTVELICPRHGNFTIIAGDCYLHFENRIYTGPVTIKKGL